MATLKASSKVLDLVENTGTELKNKDTYTINDIRWAHLKSFTAGFIFACVVIAGVVNLLLSLKGLLQ